MIGTDIWGQKQIFTQVSRDCMGIKTIIIIITNIYQALTLQNLPFHSHIESSQKF